MPFDIPDYCYGLADAVLTNIDYLITVSSKNPDKEAVRLLEEARFSILAYKDQIFDEVMAT